MSIQYFCGRPGSGKSYGVVENVIIPALKINRPIYTNIPLNIQEICKDYPQAIYNLVQFESSDLDDRTCPGEYLMTIPGGALIIIDECWRWWSAGVKVTDIPKLDKEFYAEHRHKVGDDGLTQEIILVSQSPAQIAKYVRDLIDSTVLTIKNNAVGSEKTFTVNFYSACISSIDRPGEPQSTGLGRYKPDIYKYYQSHTKNNSAVGLPGVELRADKRGTIWSHWYIRYLMPVVFLCSIWAVYEFYYIYKVKYAVKPPMSQVQPPQMQPPSNGLPLTSVQVLPAVVKIYSKRYRIAGQINADGILKVYVHDSTQPGLIIMGSGDCSIGEMRQTQCKVDGEVVTISTGVRPAKPKPTETDFKQLVPTVAVIDAVK